MSAMLADLLASLAAEIATIAGIDPVLSPERERALTGSGLLNREGLVALMLRRADEQRIAAAFAAHGGGRKLPLLSRLVGDPDPAVAAAAMALVVARGRRRDPFGQPRLELSDLDPDDRSPVVHAVAAALAAAPNELAPLAAAADAVVGAVDDSQSLDEAVAALAGALAASSRDGEALLAEASAEGEAALVAHLLARRAAIRPQAAWDHLLDAGEGGLALVAGMAGLERRTAARLIADFAAGRGTASAEEEIGRFDALGKAETAAALAFWRLPRDFRIARTRLGLANG